MNSRWGERDTHSRLTPNATVVGLVRKSLRFGFDANVKLAGLEQF